MKERGIKIMELIIVICIGLFIGGIVVGIADKIDEKYGYTEEELEN